MTSNDFETRLNNLEILFSEQEYTVQTLNDMVARQGDELVTLLKLVELQRQQLKELKETLPSASAPAGDEKPPHY